MPRYGRIVAELRGRIETGELAPGDRVPSTREITRRWGVAMATATKVLTELRHEGLVHAVPGVGTVVSTTAARPARTARPVAAQRTGTGIGTRPAPRRGPGRGPGQEDGTEPGALALDRIVEAAVAVADAEGLAALSMRRVAAELGVATMSLYRHVADKDDLLVRMMDTVIAGHPLPAAPPPGWREPLELAARQLWGVFRAHPWLAPALSMTRPQLITSALAYSEWGLSALHRNGLDLQTAFTSHLMLLNYVRGLAVNLEAEREAEAQSGLDSEEWMDTREPEVVASFGEGPYPTLALLAERGYDFGLDDLFEFGLQRLLDGLAPLLGGASPS
ncbi:TetR/AcrR family transcriptional regulator C-terminal domain-containing protein [Streptomyces griseus]|uniref:TetR/AcrR family transcriptional regulator C-terminal domain-containing protein n=1 Tax=Streptomyces griseus TaxID=1911 RepID=UPI001F467005|nr:TetR/AcrR family transcriptional regulator C-terminal domain-containing protein [Streptomyces griseus]